MHCVVPSYRIFTPPDRRTDGRGGVRCCCYKRKESDDACGRRAAIHPSFINRKKVVPLALLGVPLRCCEVASRCRPVVGCCVSLSHGASKDARVLVEVFFLANQSVIIRRAHDYTARHQSNHPSSGVGLPVTLAAKAAELIDS